MSLAEQLPTVRAAVYARISKDDAGDMLGVRRQERDARALCDRKGWSVAEVFVDDDVSAWSGRTRPAYRRMLEAIANGDVDAIVAYDLDRLHRLPRELEAFFDTCDAAGLTRMATVSGDVDLSTNDGRLVARIMGAVAKKSSDDTSRRLKRRFDDKAAAGEPHGARAFGYQPDGRTIDRREAKLLREAARDVLAGESLNTIARRWNDLGVLTPQRQRPWSGTVVKAVLTNPRQAGMRVHRGEVVGPGQWPAVLAGDTHRRLVAVLADPTRRRRTPPRRQEWTGFIRCGRCGAPLDRDSVRGTPTYRCHRRPGREGCGGLSVTALALEELILEAVLQRTDEAELSALGDDADAGEGSDAADELVELERRMAELADMFAAGEINRTEWQHARRGIDQRRGELRTAVANATRATAAHPLLTEPGALRSAWPQLSLDQRRAILGELIDRVEVAPATRKGRGFDARRVVIEWRI